MTSSLSRWWTKTNDLQLLGFINGVDNVNWPPYTVASFVHPLVFVLYITQSPEIG